MKYLQLDQTTLKIIDSFFNNKFAYSQLNEITVNLYNIFPWTYDFNSEDIRIMFEDLQREIYLQYYVPKKYLKSPIMFLNFVMKQIPCLRNNYLKPYNTKQIFRLYYFEHR